MLAPEPGGAETDGCISNQSQTSVPLASLVVLKVGVSSRPDDINCLGLTRILLEETYKLSCCDFS